MGPARNSSEPAPRAIATPYSTRSRRTRSSGSSDLLSKDTNDFENDTYNDEGDAATFKDNGMGAVSREHCTELQLEELNKLFWSSWGFPNHDQKQDLADRIGKSYHSTDVWMQNRRHPRDQSKKPWFLKLGLTKQIIEQLEQIEKDLLYLLFKMACPTLDLEPPAPSSTSGKKKKRVSGLTMKRITSQKSYFNAKDVPSTAATSSADASQPSLRRTDSISSTNHNAVTPESPRSSGESNGSATPSPRQSPSCDAVQDRVHDAGEEAQSLTIEEAAAIIFNITRGLAPTAEPKPFHLQEIDTSYASASSSCDPIRTQVSGITTPHGRYQTRASHVRSPYGRPPTSSKATTTKVCTSSGAISDGSTVSEQARTVNTMDCSFNQHADEQSVNVTASLTGQPGIVFTPATPHMTPNNEGILVLSKGIDTFNDAPANGDLPLVNVEQIDISPSSETLALLPYISPTKARYSQSNLRTSSPLGANMKADKARGEGTPPLQAIPSSTILPLYPSPGGHSTYVHYTAPVMHDGCHGALSVPA